ncbi:axonemal dynein light intermediate polypeptide 1-like isoform X2 [Portunus trituberculatus]|uniref:axonemal dynein light intermediate polypeptide 1-like isoform X2 n=1 Tax=Portunus trituberculatus TaxID=210409 RepID=UPI001E1CF089|nr:axonemal dynein light intermediate polypeptide 1-like isoform X2 [Portunus trituberculatus]
MSVAEQGGMSDDGLLQLEEPLRVADDGTLESAEPQDVEETEDDLQIITAALDLDGEEEEEEQEETERERGEKIIDVLIPPSVWEEEDETETVRWIQRVSREPPTRTGVIQLWEQLDLKIKEQQARPRGICAIRRSLYRQCFDELIRQVTLDCPERGLLLSRVRDEASMTMAAFLSLFISASHFGSSKATQAEAGKWELEGELQALEEEVAGLQAEVRRLEAWKRQVGRRWEERREVQVALFSEELECLERSEKQYQVLIETLLASRNP